MLTKKNYIDSEFLNVCFEVTKVETAIYHCISIYHETDGILSAGYQVRNTSMV